MNKIKVNPCQKGNPVLRHIVNTGYSFCKEGEIPVDFELGSKMGANYLSLRYHVVNRDYIFKRFASCKGRYALTILLVLCDAENPERELMPMTAFCARSGVTMIVAWSLKEAGRYLETYKKYENRNASALQERKVEDPAAQVAGFLTEIRSVNKTDAKILVERFGCIRQISRASFEDLVICHGLGEKKARKISVVFNAPFLPQKKRQREK